MSQNTVIQHYNCVKDLTINHLSISQKTHVVPFMSQTNQRHTMAETIAECSRLLTWEGL